MARRGATGLMGPYVLEDVHKYRVNRHSFTVYLAADPDRGEVDHDDGEPGVEHRMADRFEMNLNVLSTIDPSHPILVNMASCGGNWIEGMQIFSAILACPNPITVVATKYARSMTSIIPLAADKFVIRPPTQYMFHMGSYGFIGLEQEANTDDIERRRSLEMMFRIYIARLRSQGCYQDLSETKIRKLLEDKIRSEIDVWLTADEAVDWGFADELAVGPIERALEVNEGRREEMMEVLRRPINVKVTVS